MKHIGYNIKRLRLSLGLNQEKFGELIGVSKVAVCMWETHFHKIGIRYMHVLAIRKAFNISEEALLRDNSPEEISALEMIKAPSQFKHKGSKK